MAYHTHPRIFLKYLQQMRRRGYAWIAWRDIGDIIGLAITRTMNSCSYRKWYAYWEEFIWILAHYEITGHSLGVRIGLPWAHRTISVVEYWPTMSSRDTLHSWVLDHHEHIRHLPWMSIGLPWAHRISSVVEYWFTKSSQDTLHSWGSQDTFCGWVLAHHELTRYPPWLNWPTMSSQDTLRSWVLAHHELTGHLP